MLVAWRVKQWVEPFLCRTLTITSRGWRPTPEGGSVMLSADTLLSLLGHGLDGPFWRDTTRHLCLADGYADALPIILVAFPGIEDLRLAEEGELALFSALAVKRLHTCAISLFQAFPLDHPFYSQLTHLALSDTIHASDDETTIAFALPRIPHLSHLSFGYPNMISMLLLLLQTCRALRALVSVTHWRAPAYGGFAGELAKDVRFVSLPCTDEIVDWQSGAQWGLDYWARADAFIEKRRSGEIDALQFTLVDEPSPKF